MYKNAYSKLSGVYQKKTEKNKNKYNELFEKYQTMKVKEANNMLLIEKYKEALEQAQKLAMLEKEKNTKLTMLNEIFIIGI